MTYIPKIILEKDNIAIFLNKMFQDVGFDIFQEWFNTHQCDWYYVNGECDMPFGRMEINLRGGKKGNKRSRSKGGADGGDCP